MDKALPTRLDDFSCSWLTTALRNSGTISVATSVQSVDATVLGQGKGFVGDLARLALRYEGPPGPAAVVAKIPTQVEENRAVGQLMGVYEREVRAYADLLPTLDVPVPGVYFAQIAADPEAQQRLDRMKKVDRFPIWILRRLLRGQRLQTDAPAAVILLEDLSDSHCGDQVAGCSLEQAAQVLTVAAQFHASGWGPRLPSEKHWLQAGNIVPRLFHAAFLESRKGFEAFAAPYLSDHSGTLLKKVRKSGTTRIGSLHEAAPRCVLHGDLRLDNIFFESDDSVRAVIDWQVPNLGPAVLDLAYFITSSVPHDTPEEGIDCLLTVYHEVLVEAGVEDYALSRLQADYDEALLILLHRFASLDTMEFGDERGVTLITEWSRRFDARLARIPA